MPAAISGPTGIPPINATPITVPINRPATNTGCYPIKNTPRPASQATKIPIRTLAIILKFKNSATGGTYTLPETSGLNTPTVKKMIPIFNPCFSTKGTNCTNAVCCISSNTVAEIVIELFWLITPRKISVTKNRETKLTFIGSRHPD